MDEPFRSLEFRRDLDMFQKVLQGFCPSTGPIWRLDVFLSLSLAVLEVRIP